MYIIIAAVNHKNTLGLDGSMPWHNKEDLQHFRNTTLHQKLIMGRKTYEGLPKKLDKRDIYVVTRDTTYPNAIHDLQSFLKAHQEDKETYFIAGGGEIYLQSMEFADKLIISKIDNEVEGDTFFPAIDLETFALTETKHFDTFELNIYERKQ